MVPVSAEAVRVTGRVEALPKGQTQWAPVTVGARFVEGDQVRALAGGSADLNLPDGSTILVAENTRFAVTKLDYDAQSRDRNTALHVVAGKLKAQVATAAVTIVRQRQSNFSISTPSGVAAVRGTIVIVAYNPDTQETLVFALPSPGQLASAARVSYVTRGGQAVTVIGGNFVRQVGNQPPTRPTSIGSLSPAAQAVLQQAANNSTANSSQLTANVVLILSEQETQQLLNAGGGAGAGAGEGDNRGEGVSENRGRGNGVGRDVDDRNRRRDRENEGRGPGPGCPSPPCGG
jgi:FecR protein